MYPDDQPRYASANQPAPEPVPQAGLPPEPQLPPPVPFQEPAAPPPPPAAGGGSKTLLKVAGVSLLVLVLCGLTAAGVYGAVQGQASARAAALQAQVAKLEASNKEKDKQLKEAGGEPGGIDNSTDTKENLLSIPELNLKINFDDRLRGLTYVHHKIEGVDVVEFSTSGLLNTIERVPDVAGRGWYVGNLTSVYFVDKGGEEPGEYVKNNTLRDLGDKLLVEQLPENMPFAEPGFEDFNKVYNEQKPVLKEYLQKAEFIKT
ncbi:hypothetical protein JNJ66_06200 [Candidatus Saccharibacteria bacterium]|nr:hypothetical protein [Candidatus Saccharibacteria bacterium]